MSAITVQPVDQESTQQEPTKHEISKVLSWLGKKNGRLGGLKSAQNMTAEQRSQRARKAVETRWANNWND